jgi:hypothetical protein
MRLAMNDDRSEVFGNGCITGTGSPAAPSKPVNSGNFRARLTALGKNGLFTIPSF